MTKSKTITAALAALTLAASLAITSGQAQAHPKFGKGLQIGLAVGTAISVAAASDRYAVPVYIDGECRYIERYDRRGRLRVFKVCEDD
jgi:hypothetical protein